MFRDKFFLFALLAGCGSLCVQAQFDGFVTRIGTPEDFDVSGIHVLCRAAGTVRTKDMLDHGRSCVPHIYGEHLLVSGRFDKKNNTLYLTDIQFLNETTGQSVSGFAVVDAVIAPGLMRADGHAIQLGPSTHVEPASPGSTPQVGQWLNYAGKRAADGAIQASLAEFFEPEVTKSEQKLRDKNEFDPSAVSEEQRQSGAAKFFRGTDYKRIPAAHDDDLQTRVTALGDRLVPAAQTKLAEGDPNKIDFRFQIVESHWGDAISLPNGIILVPKWIASELNDDQLAAVLADNIATALEKQGFRSLPAAHAMTATAIAGVAGGFLIPGLSLATAAGNAVAAHNIRKYEMEGSGRVALTLMHDAGFDVQQAPVAWWRLSSSKPDYQRSEVPDRAAYLFQVLSTDWLPDSPLRREASNLKP